MTQEYAPGRGATSGLRFLAKVLATAMFATLPLAVTATPASTDTLHTAAGPAATATQQAGANYDAPCRRWQNPRAYGHWHCR